jgi:hypothetical protein
MMALDVSASGMGCVILAMNGSSMLWYAIVEILPSRDLAVMTETNAGDEAAAQATVAVATALADE